MAPVTTRFSRVQLASRSSSINIEALPAPLKNPTTLYIILSFSILLVGFATLGLVIFFNIRRRKSQVRKERSLFYGASSLADEKVSTKDGLDRFVIREFARRFRPSRPTPPSPKSRLQWVTSIPRPVDLSVLDRSLPVKRKNQSSCSKASKTCNWEAKNFGRVRPAVILSPIMEQDESNASERDNITESFVCLPSIAMVLVESDITEESFQL